jgi:hypothetical protein
MTVFLTTTETENEAVLQWHATEVGDVVDNPNGIHTEHPTLIALGAVRLQVADEPPQEFRAPHILILPLNNPYRFTVVEPGVLYCVYSKLSGAAAEVEHLITNDTVVWPSGG